MAEVQRTGRVGRDELQVDVLPGEGVGVPVLLALGDDGARQLARGARGEAEVEESGPGDVHGLDLGHRAQPRREQLGDGARGLPGPVRELEGHVGRVVAVVAVLRPLDGHGLRDGHGQLAVFDGGGHGVDDGLGQLLGSHLDKGTGNTEDSCDDSAWTRRRTASPRISSGPGTFSSGPAAAPRRPVPAARRAS